MSGREERGAGICRKQKTRKSDRRIFFTSAATICNDSSIQPRRPQFIFAGQHLLTNAMWQELQDALPDNVYLKRMGKGWNNSAQLVLIVRIMGLILAPLLPDWQPALYLDAAPLHLNEAALAEIAAAGFWYVVIPARLTWLLQPLDTHVFSRYKQYLRMRFADEVGGPSKRRAAFKMIQLTSAAARGVLQASRWRGAFAGDGLLGDQAELSSYARAQLDFDGMAPVLALAPSLATMRLRWPRNKRAPEGTAFLALPGGAASSAAAALPAPRAELRAGLLDAGAGLDALFLDADGVEEWCPPECFAADSCSEDGGRCDADEADLFDSLPDAGPAACAASGACGPAAGEQAAPPRHRVRSKSNWF